MAETDIVQGRQPQGSGISNLAGYITQFSYAGSPVVYNTAALQGISRTFGYDPQQAYTDYVISAQRAGMRPQDFGQWFSGAVNTLGSGVIAQQLANQYEVITGQRASAQMMNELSAALNNAPPTVRSGIAQQIVAASTGQMTAAQANAMFKDLTGSNSWLSAIIGRYEYAATGGQVGTPTPAQQRAQALDNSNISYFHSKFGRDPSSSELSAMRGMSQDQQDEWMGGMVYKNGITLGAWNTAEENIGSLYKKYFGRPANDAEITWASGKTAEQINQHIMDSPSNVDGLNLGQYESYHTALSKISNELYGYDAPDKMIELAHRELNK